MNQRHLGELTVSALGLGCMSMSDFYDDPAKRDESEAEATINHALALGITFFDTADEYGPFTNEMLVGRVLKGRDDVVVATKFGFERMPDGTRRINGRPEYVKRACDASLQRLQRDAIDLYYQHRIDKNVPVEETVGAMADLVAQGKVRHIGLSEASDKTIRRAAAIHKITAIQSEYNLFARDVEASVLPTCRELGIGFVAYSPLGRGLLTGAFKSPQEMPEGDARREKFPRFSAENFEKNRKLVARIEAMAQDKHVTAAQLAIAWVLHQGDNIVPIPGTKRRSRLEENAAATEIHFTKAELEEITDAIPPDAVAGERHWEMSVIER